MTRKISSRDGGVTRSERSAAQQHFLKLCDMLGVDRPPTQRPEPDEYTFEKSMRRIGHEQPAPGLTTHGPVAAPRSALLRRISRIAARGGIQNGGGPKALYVAAWG